MNFSSMDYFITVARERSFSRAAERLHITQQTLSAHIAGLEKELGTKLLVRSIPLELTYAGEVFMEREFQDLTGNQRGLLRIGVATIRGRIVMPSILTRFRARYPKIAIRLVEDENGKLLEYLENREIDLAVALFPQVVPGVELVDFYQEEVVLLVPQAILDQVSRGRPSCWRPRRTTWGRSGTAFCPRRASSPPPPWRPTAWRPCSSSAPGGWGPASSLKTGFRRCSPRSRGRGCGSSDWGRMPAIPSGLGTPSRGTPGG